MTDPEIIMPLGWEAGRPIQLYDALAGLAVEMLAHRSDLMVGAEDLLLGTANRFQFMMQAHMLERYASAIQSIALQLRPERWKVENFAGLLEMAKENNVTLPDWMTHEPSNRQD